MLPKRPLDVTGCTNRVTNRTRSLFIDPVYSVRQL